MVPEWALSVRLFLLLLLLSLSLSLVLLSSSPALATSAFSVSTGSCNPPPPPLVFSSLHSSSRHHFLQICCDAIHHSFLSLAIVFSSLVNVLKHVTFFVLKIFASNSVPFFPVAPAFINFIVATLVSNTLSSNDFSLAVAPNGVSHSSLRRRHRYQSTRNRPR